MTLRLSKLFGMDIYSTDAEYKGKIFDIVINLEKGKLETITTEPLKVRTKEEAKRIISDRSIPYQTVVAAKDILLVGNKVREEMEEEAPISSPRRAGYAPYYRKR